MYIVTAYPNYRLCAGSDQAGRAAEMEVLAESGAGEPGHRLLRRGQSRRHGRRRQIYFQHARRQTIAVDVKTGSPLWRTQLGNINKGETITMAPAGRRQAECYVGDSGGEMGVRGWVAALDENTGKLIWRAYSTGPDAEVLIGSDFKPHYAARSRQGSRRQNLAAGGLEDWRRHGVGLDHLRRANSTPIYHGTGNPGPWNQEQRPGDNKWTAGIFARDPADRRGTTGSTNTRRTMSMTMTASTSRSCSTCRSRERCKRLWYTSTATVMSTSSSATTGTVLSADPYGPVNSSRGIDLQDRPADHQSGEANQARRDGAQHLSHRIGSKGLESEQLQSADGAALHPP